MYTERSKGRPSEETHTVVVYKKTRSKKHILTTFVGNVIDEILEPSKRKPLIAGEYEIIELGLGQSFIEKYKKMYKL